MGIDDPTSAMGLTPLSADGESEPVARPVLLGPVPCVIERAKDRFRFHFICKTPVGYHVSDCIRAALASVGSREGISLSVDVDAYDLM